MTLQELLQSSIQAEQSGIAVDWRMTAHNILRDASAGVAELEEQLASKKEELAAEIRFKMDVHEWYLKHHGEAPFPMVDAYRADKEKEAETPIDVEEHH